MSVWLWLTRRYRCRCGAIVRERYRLQHEEFHAAIRDFMSPPSYSEIQAALKAPADPQAETPGANR